LVLEVSQTAKLPANVLASKVIHNAYLIFILLVAALLSSPPYSFMALILLMCFVYSFYEPLTSELNLALTFFASVLAPLLLEASAAGFYAVFLVVPALALLDGSLRGNASSSIFCSLKGKGSEATYVLKSLAAALFLTLVASLVLQNRTLMVTSILLAGYLSTVFAYVIHEVSKMPLEESKTLIRVLVGEKIETKVTVKGKSGARLHVFLRPQDQWVSVNPSNFTFGGIAEFDLAFTPPLAGPSKVRVQALMVDQWGLTQTSQTLEPVDLHIIPRARYAEWLARKYLEETAPGASPAAAVPPLRAVKAARRGVEYHGSRLYQPGDRLKEVDWKHTLKLGELVVKEFLGAQDQPVIIGVNLAVEDVKEADEVAYSLVMSALTFAREAAPTGLAAYNMIEVLAVRPPVNPRETLKEALRLTRDIAVIDLPRVTLEPAKVQYLRRALGQLEQVEAEPARKLSEVLGLEYEAARESAQANPASLAIRKAASYAKPPATIVTISAMNHDAEALTMGLEELERKGYNIISAGLRNTF